MKRLLLLALGLGLLVSSALKSEISVESQAEMADILQRYKVVVLYVYHEHDKKTGSHSTINNAMERLSEMVPGVAVAKVNIQRPQLEVFMHQYKIEATPTIVLFKNEFPTKPAEEFFRFDSPNILSDASLERTIVSKLYEGASTQMKEIQEELRKAREEARARADYASWLWLSPTWYPGYYDPYYYGYGHPYWRRRYWRYRYGGPYRRHYYGPRVGFGVSFGSW